MKLGRVVGVFGLQGWVKVHSYTRPPDNILRYRRWQVGSAEHAIEEGRAHGRGLAVKLEGVADRDAAIALVGQDIAVERSRMPRPKKGEVYWADLIGARVVSQEGVDLGELSGVAGNGAQDVMIVQSDVERLIPYVVGPIVKSVDAAGRRIVVDWQPEY